MKDDKKRARARRRAPQQKRSKELVSVILEATSQVLETHGYRGCSTNRVAQKAGVSIGSIYQYFPNKEDLIASVLSNLLVENRETFDFLSTSEPFGQAEIDPVLYGMVRNFFEKRKLMRILMDEVPAAVRNQGLVKNRQHYMTFLKTRLAPATTRFDPDSAAFVIIHAIIGALHGTLLDDAAIFEPREMAIQLTKLIRGYLQESQI